MEPAPHIQPVETPAANKARSAMRAKPAKPIPTDRMKFEVQVRVLQTLGRMGTDKRVIEPERLSQAMNNEVSKYTAPLSHGFFVECGWLEKVGRGEYTASDALLDYARRHGAGSTSAMDALRATVHDAWFWRVIEPSLRHGPAPLPEIMVSLMQEAEVGQAHKPQIRMLLEWLKYVGLITLAEDKVGLVATGGGGDAPPLPEDNKPPAPPKPPADPAARQPPADPALPGSTTKTPGRPGVPLLSFDFDFQLTADDLAKLSAEQIRALFEAVGAVMAVKNSR